MFLAGMSTNTPLSQRPLSSVSSVPLAAEHKLQGNDGVLVKQLFAARDVLLSRMFAGFGENGGVYYDSCTIW